jgi:hypothetical protein
LTANRNPGVRAMKQVMISLVLAGGFIALNNMEANAAACVRGVHRAGCVAPGGAAVVRRGVVAPRRAVVRRGVVAPRRAVVRRRAYR